MGGILVAVDDVELRGEVVAGGVFLLDEDGLGVEEVGVDKLLLRLVEGGCYPLALRLAEDGAVFGVAVEEVAFGHGVVGEAAEALAMDAAFGHCVGVEEDAVAEIGEDEALGRDEV